MTTTPEFLKLFAAGQLPVIPEECECREELRQLHAYLTELARFTGAMNAGDLSATLSCGGPLAGRLKGLHANLRHLTWQTQQVAAGDFNQRVACLGEFSGAFNRMVEALAQARAELLASNQQLALAYEELKATQAKLLQQDKMASIGQLAAGVAHEINNPMGFILSNLGTLSKYSGRLAEFISAQAEAIERLNSGTAPPDLPATVKAKRSSLRIDRALADIGDLIEESVEGGTRIKQIVTNLKSFSHIDEAEQQPADLNAAIASTLDILANELQDKVMVSREFGELPLLPCNVGQLNQVFMNILVNAAQAVTPPGEIRIRTRCDGETIVVAISDNGCGMPPEVISRIFEPFFTTREIGKGTGLGLSIAYDIVTNHHGTLEVESQVDQGTTITIRLPLAGETANDDTPTQPPAGLEAAS